MLAAQIGRLHARLVLTQHAYDLIFGKSASPHHSSPSDELTYQWHDFWGAGHFNRKVGEVTPQPKTMVQPCPETSVLVEKKKEKRKPRYVPVYFITSGKPLGKKVLPGWSAKQLGIKEKSDRYIGKYIPRNFEDSKEATDGYLHAGDLDDLPKEVDAAGRRGADYDRRMRAKIKAGFNTTYVTVPYKTADGGTGIRRMEVLTERDGSIICSDIDLLAVFDPEDDLGMLHDSVGHGISTNRQRALITALKPFYIEFGVEAQNPDATFPIRDGIATCNGKPFCPDGVGNCDKERKTPCSQPLKITGKWFLYKIDVEMDEDVVLGFRGPSLVRSMTTEQQVVDVFNDRTFNPTRVRPAKAWLWTENLGRWAPGKHYVVPEVDEESVPLLIRKLQDTLEDTLGGRRAGPAGGKA